MTLLFRIRREIAKLRIKRLERLDFKAGNYGLKYVNRAIRLRNKYQLESWKRPVYY